MIIEHAVVVDWVMAEWVPSILYCLVKFQYYEKRGAWWKECDPLFRFIEKS